MKRRNKGFTLIELLAVIVILAIIALIAVPVVMNIITKARKSAFKDSAYGIIKAGELYYADRLLESEGMTEDKMFTFPNDTIGLDIKGSKPTSGSVIVTIEGEVAIGVTDGKYCITKGFEDSDVTVTEDVVNCRAMYTNGIMISENNCIMKSETCLNIDEGIEVIVQVNNEQTEKFYVLADNGIKLTLLLNRNLGDDVQWYEDEQNNSYGPITALTYLQSQTSTWTNLPEIIVDSFGSDDGREDVPLKDNQLFTMYARLPKYNEIEAINNSGRLTATPWLYRNLYRTGNDSTYGYWTSAAYPNSTHARYIDWGGVIGYTAVDGTVGVRPVIELSK